MIFDHDDLQLGLLDVLEFDDTDYSARTRERSFCALSLRMEGNTEIRYRNRQLHMTDRDLAFFPANLAYTRHAVHDRMIVFHFTASNYVGYDIQVLHDFRYEQLLPLFEEAARIRKEKAPGWLYAASALLYRIFAELRAARSHSDARPEYSPPIAAALALMNDRLADPALTVSELAGTACMCETYFRRQFRRELGVSPKQYLSDLRMERAQTLLNAGYDSVALTAEKCGFGDPKNFASAFKKRFGYPPSKQEYIP